MKKLFLFAALAGFGFGGCQRIYDVPPDVVYVGGCEYLKTPVKGGYTLTHKANCKNPIHNQK